MKNCCKSLRKYFWPEEKTLYLHECFLMNKKSLLFLRMFLFLVSFGIYTMSNIIRGSFYKYYMYLTYWGEVLTMLAFLTLLLDNILYIQGFYRAFKIDESHLSRAAHLLFELAFSFELAIVLLFWLDVPTDKQLKDSFFYTQNLLAHGSCLILLWIENIFNYIEFFPRHLILVFLLALAYVVDNVIVVFCINFDTVYTILTWTDSLTYCCVVGCILLTFIHFGIAVLLFRKWKFKKCAHLAQNNYDLTVASPNSYEMEKRGSS